MIEHPCGACGRRFWVPEELAGSAVACPACRRRSPVARRDEPEPPEPRQWRCLVAGKQFGPVPETVMRQWVHEGRVGPDHSVWTGGMSRWVPLRLVRGVFHGAEELYCQVPWYRRRDLILVFGVLAITGVGPVLILGVAAAIITLTGPVYCKKLTPEGHLKVWGRGPKVLAVILLCLVGLVVALSVALIVNAALGS